MSKKLAGSGSPVSIYFKKIAATNDEPFLLDRIAYH
jgi:hypothetical protein